MIAPERLASMRLEWEALLARHGVAAGDARAPLERLVALYSAPERSYHNLEHLAEMFEVVDRLAPATDDPDAVRLAVWFHDAVHDTRAKDNEERSAEVATEMLTHLSLSKPVVDRVAQLVRATAHLSSHAPPPDRDTATLLDADLAILGSAPGRYARYARDVRLEYRWVPKADYREGRAAVLRAFLDRPRIYHHRITFEEGEARARQNLAGELASLAVRR
jgi:predicted metal-dependent HD superfamily phosphohydrolase